MALVISQRTNQRNRQDSVIKIAKKMEGNLWLGTADFDSADEGHGDQQDDGEG
jgi:hypothetical protein